VYQRGKAIGGKSGDRAIPTYRGQLSQCGNGQLIVGVRKRGAPGRGESEVARRPTTMPLTPNDRVTPFDMTLGKQTVQMTPHRGRTKT
jgi:hypothetical protein